MKISVLGLGYIGLPTASILATNGNEVSGIDISISAVNTINKGGIHIEEPGLKTLVEAAVKSGNLKAYTEVRQADIYIIAVPTPITEDKRADLSCVGAAAQSLLPILKQGDLVILESTSPPGTTKDFLCPILEKSGLKIGKDLFVAHCPERVLPGKIISELIQNTRIVGGINDKSAQMAKRVYECFVEGEIHLTDASTAEMVKVMENTYRDVNIALANELAKISYDLGVNCWEVIKLANLHPRVNYHQPGPGVGGHCISVDPWFIVEKFPEISKLIHSARLVNDSMPEFTYKLIEKHTQNISNPKITVLGVSYKANVDDCRESPSEKIIEYILKNNKFNLSIYDPHVKQYKYELSNFEDAFKSSDCVVLAVDHTEFKYIDADKLAKLVRNKLIIDTRNVLDSKKWTSSGFKYLLLGDRDCSVNKVK